MKRCACTIVSANYLHFAWTLAESFLNLHPEDEFHLLLVDKRPSDLEILDTRVKILGVEELGLPAFQSLAFKFDILELNTAVKPSFLKHLLRLDFEKLIYFDPDIYIFDRVDLIYEALEQNAIVLTPHILTPTLDPEHIYEKDFLGTGVFNLGFVAVSNSSEGRSFLDWWEERCLQYGYVELRSGLFVDQKWVNLVPCLFTGVSILRDAGCNVAYWNLHERKLLHRDGRYVVNDSSPLIFFHYSGYSHSRPDKLSRKLRTDQEYDETLLSLLRFYGDQLQLHGADHYQQYSYGFNTFSNGALVPLLARRLYSVTMEHWVETDPFDAEGRFYAEAKKAGLLSSRDRSGQYSSNNLPMDDIKLKIINRLLFALPRFIGGDRYSMLMKYLSFISIYRHQRALLLGEESRATTVR